MIRTPGPSSQVQQVLKNLMVTTAVSQMLYSSLNVYTIKTPYYISKMPARGNRSTRFMKS